MRNRCWGNQENQAVLASIDGEGVAINTLEDEFGIGVARRKNEEEEEQTSCSKFFFLL